MIFRDRDLALGQGLQSTPAVKPCRGNEPRDRKANHILDQRSARLDPRLRFVFGQPQELALAGCHPPRAQPVGDAVMRREVVMIKTVKEDLQPGFGPSAQPARER